MSEIAVRRGIRFDPTINLGHIATAAVFLATTTAAWVTLDARATRNADDIRRVEAQSKETVGRAETELSRRIVEQRQYMNDIQITTTEGLREIKTLMRDGFKTLEEKLDKKADKPGR